MSLGAAGETLFELSRGRGEIWEGSRQNPNCTVGSSLNCIPFHPFCFDNLTSCHLSSGNGFPARVINSYGTILFSHIIFWLCFSLVQALVVGAVKVRARRLWPHMCQSHRDQGSAGSQETWADLT